MKILSRLVLTGILLGETGTLADESGQSAGVGSPKQKADEREAVPTTLQEAHQQLERLFPKEELAKIDAMQSEDDMIEYHFGIGMAIRNRWGLWRGSALAEHMRGLGFNHPDDMSGVILETFWCKRHGKDFRLKERADYYAAYWKSVADAPPTALDPGDGSKIDWLFSFDAGDAKTPRQIHVGKSKKTGRWLAFEHDTGVYVPDGPLLQRIVDLDKQ